MAKTFEFEVSTGLDIIEPTGFSASLSALGADVFDKPTFRGLYIETSSGISVRPKDQYFRATDEAKTRYIHFDRVVEPFGSIGFKFLQFLTETNPSLRTPDTIDGVDLESDIAAELKQKIGEDSIKNHSADFLEIRDVPSSKEPGKRLFILTQTKEKSSKVDDSQCPNKEVDNNPEIIVVNPFIVITDFVRKYVKENHPDIYSLRDNEAESVENGIIVGSTTDINPDKIENFKYLFRRSFLSRDNVVTAKIGAIEVKFGI